jgi:hypothetical protein
LLPIQALNQWPLSLEVSTPLFAQYSNARPPSLGNQKKKKKRRMKKAKKTP